MSIGFPKDSRTAFWPWPESLGGHLVDPVSVCVCVGRGRLMSGCNTTELILK
jgi:hypothetical protein